MSSVVEQYQTLISFAYNHYTKMGTGQYIAMSNPSLVEQIHKFRTESDDRNLRALFGKSLQRLVLTDTPDSILNIFVT